MSHLLLVKSGFYEVATIWENYIDPHIVWAKYMIAVGALPANMDKCCQFQIQQ